MERGKQEEFCLETIKSCFNDNIFYVCSVEEREEIEKAFKFAIPNPDLSKFPDFIFQNGFIEHFEITSSYSNRKGSKMMIEKNRLDKEVDDKNKELMKEMSETPCFEGKTITTEIWHSKHTYDNFFNSFKKNWENHIDSLNYYDGEINTGIFMIQYNDSALITDNIYPDIKTGIYYGDLLPKEAYNGYRLTRDANVLEYIYQYKDKIKYIAFLNNDGFHGKKCEIIKIENIPEIIKIIKGKYKFHCATVGTSHYTYGISHKNY